MTQPYQNKVMSTTQSQNSTHHDKVQSLESRP